MKCILHNIILHIYCNYALWIWVLGWCRLSKWSPASAADCCWSMIIEFAWVWNIMLRANMPKCTFDPSVECTMCEARLFLSQRREDIPFRKDIWIPAPMMGWVPTCEVCNDCDRSWREAHRCPFLHNIQTLPYWALEYTGEKRGIW